MFPFHFVPPYNIIRFLFKNVFLDNYKQGKIKSQFHFVLYYIINEEILI